MVDGGGFIYNVRLLDAVNLDTMMLVLVLLLLAVGLDNSERLQGKEGKHLCITLSFLLYYTILLLSPFLSCKKIKDKPFFACVNLILKLTVLNRHVEFFTFVKDFCMKYSITDVRVFYSKQGVFPLWQIKVNRCKPMHK